MAKIRSNRKNRPWAKVITDGMHPPLMLTEAQLAIETSKLQVTAVTRAHYMFRFKPEGEPLRYYLNVLSRDILKERARPTVGKQGLIDYCLGLEKMAQELFKSKKRTLRARYIKAVEIDASSIELGTNELPKCLTNKKDILNDYADFLEHVFIVELRPVLDELGVWTKGNSFMATRRFFANALKGHKSSRAKP